MSEITNTLSSSPARVALSDTLLASARNVQAVLAGQSLSVSLAATPAPLRAATQAISFHVMRRLGLAREVKNLLVARAPVNPLFDALLLVSLALLDTAIEHADDIGVQARRGDLPLYAPHTLVDQAVTAVASDRKMQSFKGLLNGVLRTFLREREAVLQEARKNPEAVWNFPKWWIAHVRRAWPEQWQEILTTSNRPAPMTLRVNTQRVDIQELQAQFTDAGIETIQSSDHSLVLTMARPVQHIPGFDEGLWSVQGLAAQYAGLLLPLADGMRVLDACAAPGGKTAHMLEQANISMLALDTDGDRLYRVRENLLRLQLDGPHVGLQRADAANVASWWDGVPFDAVLADVPCTASGIVRRHPDIRWLRREADIAKTAALQARIVDGLWTTVAPGGHLLYVTCSIFPQEGELQATQFMQRHPEALRLPAPGQLLPLGNDAPSETSPAAVYSDGFFYALFAKPQ
ncbi:MAG: 16S rRNA (cytosine(967)-C(5))-methyltransferase RsmB [Burkholderiaceae bacterium]|nr:16S rRNA (cytosine(967)-C(5))-methyltransferase RsmB [Burkholderiaceae bacterium]